MTIILPCEGGFLYFLVLQSSSHIEAWRPISVCVRQYFRRSLRADAAVRAAGPGLDRDPREYFRDPQRTPRCVFPLKTASSVAYFHRNVMISMARTTHSHNQMPVESRKPRPGSALFHRIEWAASYNNSFSLLFSKLQATSSGVRLLFRSKSAL